MKPRSTVYMMFASIFFLSLCNVALVQAQWSALGSGYAVTTNYHGIDVLVGTPVTAIAGTLDPAVVNVTFRWHMPNGTTRWEVTVPVYTNGTLEQWNNGTYAEIRYANDTQIPDMLGDWGVQAFFQDPTGMDKAGLSDVIEIRATSFNTMPEVPLGTIIIGASMFAALGVFALKGRISKFGLKSSRK